MDKPDDDALHRLAGSIADCTPIDWRANDVVAGLPPEVIAPLRDLEVIAQAHHGLHAVALAEQETHETAPPAPGDASEAPRSWGALRILERIGSGGFGEIFRAFDPNLRKEVALKLLRPEHERAGGAERILMEARRLAGVRHPGIVPIHGADRHDGRSGFWTDLVVGKTLGQCLAEQGPFSAREAALIGIDLCQALAAIHGAGLVHLDVKSGNVMRGQGGQILLMDFGSSVERPAAGASDRSAFTSGTPLYMSPERLLGGRIGPAADIYALGVTLYHLVSGRYPVEAADWHELRDKHKKRVSHRLRDVRPDLPAPFIEVVERALSWESSERYATTGEMESALAATLGTRARHAAGVATPMGHPRRRLTSMLSATAALAVVSAALYFGPWHRSGPLHANAALYRQGAAAVERLAPGSHVNPGDRLFLEIESASPAYVYVLNQDRQGNAFVLYPTAGGDENPLPASTRHRLPATRAGHPMTWEVTSAGGTETFLVVASREPLRDLEHDISGLPRAEEGRQVAYATASPKSLEVLRGIGGLAAAPTSPEDVGRTGVIDSATRNVADAAAAQSGVWTWRIDLDNPGERP